MNANSSKLIQYGNDILLSEGMKYEKTLLHHGVITCYDHSVRVAHMSVRLIKRLNLKVDQESLVRGALLHDYFLYDWHTDTDPNRKPHGFGHAEVALQKAGRDFSLNEIEKDIIVKHMFPLNMALPRYKESWLVCLADKICAVQELTWASRTILRRTMKKYNFAVKAVV